MLSFVGVAFVCMLRCLTAVEANSHSVWESGNQESGRGGAGNEKGLSLVPRLPNGREVRESRIICGGLRLILTEKGTCSSLIYLYSIVLRFHQVRDLPS